MRKNALSLSSILFLFALFALSACEVSDPLVVEDQPTVLPKFSAGEKPGQPILDGEWLYKDSFDNSPINLSGVLASVGSRGMSETGLLPVVILGSWISDVGSIESVTLGDGGDVDTLWEMDGQGSPLTEETFRDKDEVLDLIIHFNLRTMYEDGDIATGTVELCLTVKVSGEDERQSCKDVSVV